MSSNNTVVRTFKILDLISKSNIHLTGAEISKELDIPTSTTHDILKTLLDENVVYYKNYKSKTYAMGIRIYALSKSYIHDSNIINVSKIYLKEICDKYSISGYVLKPIYNHMLITYKYESENSIIKVPNIGHEFNRSTHKSFGAYYSSDNIHEQISSVEVPLFDYTSNAIGEIKILGLKSVIEKNKNDITNDMLQSAKEISACLGELSD